MSIPILHETPVADQQPELTEKQPEMTAQQKSPLDVHLPTPPSKETRGFVRSFPPTIPKVPIPTPNPTPISVVHASGEDHDVHEDEGVSHRQMTVIHSPSHSPDRSIEIFSHP